MDSNHLQFGQDQKIFIKNFSCILSTCQVLEKIFWYKHSQLTLLLLRRRTGSASAADFGLAWLILDLKVTFLEAFMVVV